MSNTDTANLADRCTPVTPPLWVVELHRAFLCMAANGTPDYALIDADSREAFEEVIAHGRWFQVVEELKLAAMREATAAGLDLPDAVLNELSANRVRVGAALPASDRVNLGELCREIYAVCVRLAVRGELTCPGAVNPWRVLATGPTHAPDFAWLRCALGDFTFTANQRPVIRALWEDWQAGGLGLSASYLLDQAGAETPRLTDLFKGNAALGKLIVAAGRKDTYRLDLPGDPARRPSRKS